MGVWVKIREESLFFICFYFIGVLECSRSLSAACVCVSVFRTIRRSRTCIICTHTDCRISEVSTIFSVVFEGITVPNCSCESPNSVSIHYGLTHQIQVVLIITPLFFCQLLALAQWHRASVPCFHGLVHFSCLAVWQLQYLITTNNTCIPRVVYSQTGCFGWPSVKTNGKGYL